MGIIRLMIWLQGVATNVGACHRCFSTALCTKCFHGVENNRDFQRFSFWNKTENANCSYKIVGNKATCGFCRPIAWVLPPTAVYEIGSKSISQQRHVELFADSKCFHLHLDPCYSIFIVNVLIETVANISLVEQKWRQMTYLCWRAIGWHMANPADSGEQRRWWLCARVSACMCVASVCALSMHVYVQACYNWPMAIIMFTSAVFIRRKEGRNIFIWPNDNTIHIYENAMVRRLSLRLNIAASATATEIIIIII